MKRILLSIVVLLLLLCGIAVAEEASIVASGDCGASGSNVTWKLDSAGTLTISGEGKMNDYYDSNYVPWYAKCASIKTVVIEDGVTSIGASAFYGCSSLSSISIPDGVTTIDYSAFYGCSSLSSITIPEGVTSIGNWAFGYCSSLSSISIPDGVTTIGHNAFLGCSSLSSISIPDGVTTIDYSAFYGCSSLSSITIPEGVTSIGNWAFGYCSNLSSISIPDGVASIGQSAFYGCSSLSSISIPDGVTTIGDSAFYGCSNLKKVYVDTLEGWLNIAFFSHYSTPLCHEGKLYIAGKLVTDLVLPDGMTSIGNSAFYGCSSLSSITIPEGVTSIGDWAFGYCSSLSSISIPDGVTSIGDYAFYGCSSLSSITIPEGVTSIGHSAFYECSSLSSISVPDGVTSIGDSAFEDCSSLSSINLPADLTSIGSWAFRGCSSLSSISIPDGVTTIDDGAFLGCSGLSSISIPDGVTSIGGAAFYGCSSLSSISIPDGVTSIGGSAFYGCSSLSSISIPDGVTTIGGYAFYGCSSLSSISIPDGVTSIGGWAFRGCSSLSSITIPEGVTSIGDFAFSYCSSLRKVMFLGNDMPTLGSNVFSTSPTIYCYEFSGADFWAAEQGYNCVYIDDMDLSRPISIDLPQNMRIEMGEVITISAGLFPQTAKVEIVWESSNPSVVSVENGVLTAHAVGEATITASCDEASDQMNVTVYTPVEAFELSESELWVASKQSAQLEICNIEPAGATAYFIWESSDPSVLTVDGGTISALKPGDATVTVTSDNGIVQTCPVHVCYPVTAIALEKDKYLMCLDGNAQITANVTTRDQSYVNKLVTFESSDEAIATVDQTGLIHAVSAGTATITVAADSGIHASCTVEVANQTHTVITDPAVPATHVTTGLTEGSHCSVCGEVLVAQQEIPIVKVAQKIKLPADLKTIEAEAFAGDSFVCAVIPDGCRAIGAGAFRNCAKLQFIEIPASVTSISATAFTGCSADLIIVTTSDSEAQRFAQSNDITCVLKG